MSERAVAQTLVANTDLAPSLALQPASRPTAGARKSLPYNLTVYIYVYSVAQVSERKLSRYATPRGVLAERQQKSEKKYEEEGAEELQRDFHLLSKLRSERERERGKKLAYLPQRYFLSLDGRERLTVKARRLAAALRREL